MLLDTHAKASSVAAGPLDRSRGIEDALSGGDDGALDELAVDAEHTALVGLVGDDGPARRLQEGCGSKDVG